MCFCVCEYLEFQDGFSFMMRAGGRPVGEVAQELDEKGLHRILLQPVAHALLGHSQLPPRGGCAVCMTMPSSPRAPIQKVQNSLCISRYGTVAADQLR